MERLKHCLASFFARALNTNFLPDLLISLNPF